MSSIKSAFVWSGGGKIALYLVNFISGIIMARILTPQDYGLVGLLTIFTSLSTLLIDSGYRDALIRNSNNNTNDDFSAVFYFNVLISLILYLILFICAPLIARFYDEARLTSIARFSFLSIILYALSIVQTSKLQIIINFKILARIHLYAVIISSIIGILMAIYKFGVWSLIIPSIINPLVRLLFLWENLKWRPSLTKNFSVIKKNFNFSIKLLSSRIAETLSTNLIQLIIGKLYTIDDVGFYTKAWSLQGIPNSILTTTVNEVSYPVLAGSGKDGQISAFKRMIRGVSMISFPLAIGLIFTARPLILLLLTDKWAKSIPIMQVLSLMISVMSLNYLNNSMLKLRGKVGFLLWTSVVKNILIISLLLSLMQKGIIILCYVYVGVNVLIYLIYAFNSSKVTEYSLSTQLKDIFPFLLSSLVMGGSMYMCNFLVEKSMLKLLSLQCFTGLIVIFSIYFLFFRDELFDFFYLFKNK